MGVLPYWAFYHGEAKEVPGESETAAAPSLPHTKEVSQQISDTMLATK